MANKFHSHRRFPRISHGLKFLPLKEYTRKSGDQKIGHRSVINYCLEESSYYE